MFAPCFRCRVAKDAVGSLGPEISTASCKTASSERCGPRSNGAQKRKKLKTSKTPNPKPSTAPPVESTPKVSSAFTKSSIRTGSCRTRLLPVSLRFGCLKAWEQSLSVTAGLTVRSLDVETGGWRCLSRVSPTIRDKMPKECGLAKGV